MAGIFTDYNRSVFFCCTHRRRNQICQVDRKMDMAEKVDLICPECGAPMVLRNSKLYGKFYGCTRFPACKATHGAHADGTPLGIPGNKETKQWRIKAHEAFDGWRKHLKGIMDRSEAYEVLQSVMDMSPAEAHIGRFNIEQCQRVIKIFSEGGSLWQTK
jgi:ssDNA-binding Zn-finger/Zn-ribbon topoisomerase 1